MDDGPDGADIQHAVRRYTQVIRTDMPEEPLAQGLASKIDIDIERERHGTMFVSEAIRGLFGDTDSPNILQNSTEITLLESKTRELDRLWQKFRAKSKSGEIGHLRPDLKTVIAAVEKAQTKLQNDRTQSRTGRAKVWFGRVAQTLDAYKYLFDMLPSGDKYTSVFTGAFTAIIEASSTHHKICNEISESFDNISDHVRSFHVAIKRHPESTYIKRQIALFYVTLFEFLITLLGDWFRSSWKRISNTFGLSFLEETKETLAKLASYAERIGHEEASVARSKIMSQQLILGELLEASLIENAKMREYMRTILPTQIATQVSAQVESRIFATKRMPPALPMEVPYDDDAENDTENTTSHLEGPAPLHWTREEVQKQAKVFDCCLQEAQTAKLVDAAKLLSVNSEVFFRLHRWATNGASESLWIEGPSHAHQPSQNTLTSAFLLGSLQRLGIPAIAYFCSYDTRRWQTYDREEELCKLVGSLIYQMSQFVRTVVDADNMPGLDLSTSRFAKVNKGILTLAEDIKLLGDLLSVGPPLQYCIVDGLQLLDRQDSSTRLKDGIVQLVGILSDHSARLFSDGIIVKTFFTTDGLSRTLTEAKRNGVLAVERYDDEEEDEPLRLNATAFQPPCG